MGKGKNDPARPDKKRGDQFVELNNRFSEDEAKFQELDAGQVGDDKGLHSDASRLLKSIQELQVIEEELRAQNEELIATRHSLEAERLRYQELFEFAPDGYLITNTEGAIWEANLAASRLLNAGQEFLAGKPLVVFVIPEERGNLLNQLEQLRRLRRNSKKSDKMSPAPGVAQREWEVWLQPQDGIPFEAALTVAPVFDLGSRRPVAFRWLIRDISERVRAQEALRRSEVRFRTLAETTSAATLIVQDLKIRYANYAAITVTGYSPEELQKLNFLEIVHPAYQEILKKRGLATQWVEHIPARYELKLVRKNGEERWVDLTAGAIDFEGEAAQVVTLFDITEREEAEQALRRAKSDLETRVEERTAELRLANERLEGANLQLQEELAERARSAGERERLLAQVEKERHRAEQSAAQARQQTEEMSAIFSAMADAVIVYDAGGVLIQANPAAMATFGFDPHRMHREEILRQLTLRRPDGSLIAPNEIPSQRAIRSDPVRNEPYMLTNVNGEEFHIIASSSPVYDFEGRVVGAVTVWRDVTEREHLLGQLEAEQARLRAIIENAPEGILVADSQGNIVLTNPVGKQLYARSASPDQEPGSLTGLEVCRPDGTPYDPEDLPIVRSAREGTTHTNVEMVLIWPDGHRRFLQANSAPIRDRKGEVSGSVLLFQDITERKQSEAARERLVAILEATPDYIFTITIDGKVLYINKSARENLNLPNEATFSGLDFTLLLSDWARDLLINESIPTAIEQRMWAGETAFLSSTGEEIPVSQVVIAHFDPDGKIQYLSSIARNISARKKAEAQIRKNAARAEVLAALSRTFAEAGLYYPAVLSTVVQQITGLAGDACIIGILSDDEQYLDPVAFHHPDPEALVEIRELLVSRRERADEGVAGQVLKTGQTLLIQDLLHDRIPDAVQKDYLPWLQRYPLQSALFIPLIAQGHLIGTLSVLRSQPGEPFTLEDQEFFQDLANRAALAIENARLYVAETQRAHELEALHTATSALLTTLDLDTLLTHILDAAKSAIPAAEKGILYLIAPDTGQLQVRATHGYKDPRIVNLSLPQLIGYPAQAMKERRPVISHGVRRDPLLPYDGEPSESSLIRSEIVAPLISGERVLGALSLISSKPAAFNETELRILVSFAHTTTTAIQNAFVHGEVQKLALTDSLTGFYNRRGFFELGRRELERAIRFNRPLSAIMMDIDHFKPINDNYGHATGDVVLRTLADRVRQSVREVDVLGRYGGEEFVILLPETDLFAACAVSERIRELAAEPIQVEDAGLITVTASFGVSKVTSETPDLATLVSHADSAMYSAKRNGRNRIEIG